MRVPKRKSETTSRERRIYDNFLTPKALARLKRALLELKQVERPRAVIDLSQARDMGDLSENAAYSEAKARLSRIDNRILGLQEKIKFATVIVKTTTGVVEIGSVVMVEAKGVKKTFQILGSEETNPAQGRISYRSPLGALLLKHKVGDQLTLKTTSRETLYEIIEIK